MESTKLTKINTLDIVIASARAENNTIKYILSLKSPKTLAVNFIIVLDCRPNDQSTLRYTNVSLTILENRQSLGASRSRNIGISNSKSEWILFLDDDVIPNEDILFQYNDFITKSSEKEIGGIGCINFPEPTNNFTRGVVKSKMLECYSLAKQSEKQPWGVSANLLLRRKYLVQELFSEAFPKHGGGEDIDLCIRMHKSTRTMYTSLPNAIVYHPWWNGGNRDYTRFFRWSIGDSILPYKYPQFRYFTAPNHIELLTFLAMISPIIGLFSFLKIVTSSTLIEIASTYDYRTKNHLEETISSIEALAISSCSELGKIIGGLIVTRYIPMLRFNFLAKNSEEISSIQKKEWKKLAIKILVFIFQVI